MRQTPIGTVLPYSLIFILCGAAVADEPRVRQPPMVEPYRLEGRLAQAQTALDRHLTAAPDDDQARFGPGVARFLNGVEQLVQSLHKYGLQSGVGRGMGIPVLHLPVGPQVDPQPIGYDDFRTVVRRWLDDLNRTEATLAKITDNDVQLPLRFGLIRMDLNGDGIAAEDETLWRLYAHLNTGIMRNLPEGFEEQSKAFVIAFDRGDVHKRSDRTMTFEPFE